MITEEQIFAKLNAITTTVNEYCKEPVLGDFTTSTFVKTNTFSSNIHIGDSVSVRADEIDVKIVLARAIEAQNRIITLVQTIKQKLEDLQKELS